MLVNIDTNRIVPLIKESSTTKCQQRNYPREGGDPGGSALSYEGLSKSVLTKLTHASIEDPSEGGNFLHHNFTPRDELAFLEVRLSSCLSLNLPLLF